MNTQQVYLLNAARKFCKEFSFKLDPERVIYSYGFPKGRGGRGRIIGQCFSKPVPEGCNSVIFIAPQQWKTPLDVLHVLLHELIHAENPSAGHKGAFVSKCKAVGLVKPWTATTASPELTERLNAIASTLGAFPESAFNLIPGPKKGSRLRLWECPCGVKVRVASDDFKATCGECEDVFEAQS